MAPINEKTLVDQETGYSSLSEATPLKEHKSSWRRSGVAAAVLSALALGAVAAIKTTSPMRGSKNTAFYPKATIENWSKLPVSGEVHYAGDGLFCRADSYSLKKRGDVWTAKSRGGCLLTEITATIKKKRKGRSLRPVHFVGNELLEVRHRGVRSRSIFPPAVWLWCFSRHRPAVH